MMGDILVNASIIAVVAGAGVLILLKGCSLIGRHLAHCRETQTTTVIPESVDEEFIFAGRPNYEPLRKRTQQMPDDELARQV